MSNFNEEVCEFTENSFIENLEINEPCDTGAHWELQDKKGISQTCNYWSWKDEKTEQTNELKFWQFTGTVRPGWDCWYEPYKSCVSRDCLKSSNPSESCSKDGRTFWNMNYGERVHSELVKEWFKK
jgi:hypothetical protein